ncbi:MAG: DUF3794 domain-containing protein [Lachnospiraceae bacterium]|nr:DUF3794 domain-containing protein [Lachnospiraceae bacterium]
MEVLKKNIHMYRQAKRAVNQITLEEDCNVPDAKPDVEQIIQSKEKIVIESTRAESGKLLLKGYLQVSVLYMDDAEERQIHRLDMQLKFDEYINMEGLEAGEAVQLTCEIEDLNVVLINSRKLSMRGLLTFTAVTDEIYDMTAAVDVRGSIELCEKKKKLEFMQLEVQKKDIIRVKDEILLSSNKPDIQEILWENVQLRGYEVRLMEGKILAEGELFVFILYSGRDENESKQWMEHTISFRGEVDCPDCSGELLPDVSVSLSQMEVQARQDMDGEERLIHLEGTLDVDIKLYASDELEILEDVFSPEKDLEIFTREEPYESMVMRNSSRLRATGRIRAEGTKPRILQICSSQGNIKIDDVQITETGIQIEGAVLVEILYVSAEDTMPFAVLEGSIPFSHFADIPGLDEECRYSMNTGLEQLSATMADSEEIEVRAAISLNLFVVRPHCQQCIADVSEKDLDLHKVQALPGIVGYIVQEGDSLWDIARKYYTTPKRIMSMNGLDSPQIRKGDHLIIMKELERVDCS